MPSGVYKRKKTLRWINENPNVSPYKRRSTASDYREIIVFALAVRDGWLCFYCTKELTVKTATIEHVIPVALGGEHRIENLRLSCMNCNVKRGHEIRKARGWNWRKY